MTRSHEESDLQKAVVIWLQIQENLGRLTYFAIPNNPRNAVHGARQKQEGMRAGTPDLCILAPWRVPLFIEMKSPTGKLSIDQRITADRLTEIGGAMCVICRPQEDVQKIVTGWLQTKIEARAA